MRETRTWVRKVEGPPEWVATSSPGKRDDISPVRSGARYGYRLPVGGA